VGVFGDDQSLVFTLRILHLSSAQALGGGERHLIDLVRGLSACGHELFVALRPNSPLSGELANLSPQNFLELPLRNAIDAKSAGRLAAFVRRRQIQVVHAHMARDYPIAAYATRRHPFSKLIVTRHVLFPLSRLHRVTLSRVARVIAVSEAVGRQLRAEKLVPPQKISVVHNGIDLTRFDSAISSFNRQQFCRDRGVPANSLLVGSVGSLNPLKGHEDFLRAAHQIGALFPSAHFIVAGVDVTPAQANLANLQSLIGELGLNSRISLIGKMADITPLYCALDVFVSASRTESFGLAIAEAMAAGTPVVATQTEGALEIIRDGETGLLTPLGEINSLAAAISTLLENDQRRLSMGRKARDEIRDRFSLKRMLDATERIYLEETNTSRG